MHYLCSLFLFALSCGIAGGQRLTEPSEPSHAPSLSWISKDKPVLPSSNAGRDASRGRIGSGLEPVQSSKHESIQSKAELQAALGRNEIVVNINLPRLKGNDLASIYRSCTGRRVIIFAAAAAAEFSLVHEASSQHPVTKAEVVELVKKSAVIEGFTFTPDDIDSNLDFLTNGKSNRIVCPGVDSYNEERPLPDGDIVISYVMTLKYLKPEQAMAIFIKSVGPIGPYGSMVPVANAPSILITEKTSLIRKLIELKNEIDKPQE